MHVEGVDRPGTFFRSACRKWQRREPKKETGSARAQRKARGALARAPPPRGCAVRKAAWKPGGEWLKRTWTGSMEAIGGPPQGLTTVVDVGRS